MGLPHSCRCRSCVRALLRTWSSLSKLSPAAFMTDAISETTNPITKSSHELPVTVMIGRSCVAVWARGDGGGDGGGEEGGWLGEGGVRGRQERVVCCSGRYGALFLAVNVGVVK